MYLLDTNVLLGLIWTSHDFHHSAAKWFIANRRDGWATCAMTQAGFVRISAQTVFAAWGGTVPTAIASLESATASPDHQFLDMDFVQSYVKTICTGGLLGHRQVTDAWLLATAMRHQCKLATFDRGIRQLLATPRERLQHLVVLEA